MAKWQSPQLIASFTVQRWAVPIGAVQIVLLSASSGEPQLPGSRPITKPLCECFSRQYIRNAKHQQYANVTRNSLPVCVPTKLHAPLSLLSDLSCKIPWHAASSKCRRTAVPYSYKPYGEHAGMYPDKYTRGAFTFLAHTPYPKLSLHDDDTHKWEEKANNVYLATKITPQTKVATHQPAVPVNLFSMQNATGSFQSTHVAYGVGGSKTTNILPHMLAKMLCLPPHIMQSWLIQHSN